MCDLCVELHKLKELRAFHVHFVVFLSQQDFSPASVRPASAPCYTTVTPVELPKVEKGLEANLSYAAYVECFPSGIKNT